MDKEYWENRYKGDKSIPREPSDFAQFAYVTFEPFLWQYKDPYLFELGHGNGRDAYYFISKGIRTIGMDYAGERDFGENHALCTGDFTAPDSLKILDQFDNQEVFSPSIVYSRFSLHSVDEEQEDRLLSMIYDMMPTGGLFFIEARSIHDELYGKGEKISNNEYIYDDHYRRFIDPGVLAKKLSDLFQYVQLEYRRGFAEFNGADPIVIRAVAKK